MSIMWNLGSWFLGVLLVLTLTACGGSGGGGGDNSGRGPAGKFDVSPGGIWGTFDFSSAPSFSEAPDAVFVDIDPDELAELFDELDLGGITIGVLSDYATFFISEDGKLIVQGYLNKRFFSGFGSISQSSRGGIEGTFKIPGLPEDSSVFAVVPQNYAADCELSGTIEERELIYLTMSCDFANGDYEVNVLDLFPVPDCSNGFCNPASSSYELPSSLREVEGNYSLNLPIAQNQNNEITVSSTGVISGYYDNGLSCSVTGQISVIDPSFNLYDISWTLTECEVPIYDNLEYEGLATSANIFGLGGSTTALQVMMSATIENELFPIIISVLYQPIVPE